MEQQGLALHETLELHELLVFKNVCCTKSATMQALVSDEGLRSILVQDVQASQGHIKELQALVSKGPHIQ
jgi:similar to spore coat protein